MSYGRQRIELDTAVNLVDDLSGNVILKVPYIDDIQAAIVHTARRSGFRSHIEGALGAQKVETDVTFSSKSGMSITANLKTPFQDYNEMEASLSYSGKINNFKALVKTVHAELFVLDELYQSDVILNTGNGLETSLTVKTPIRGYESTKIILNYQFGENRMQTHAELVYGNGQEFESDLILRLESPFEGTYILKTPFAGIENTKATFNYEFVNNRIQTHSEFIYGNQQRIESDVVLRVESPFEGSFTLRTPFVGFEEIASSFTHESSETSLKTHAEINYAAQKKIETDVNFSLNDRIDGSISFKTPFRHFEALSASFRHSGGSNGLKSYGEISYGPQKKIEADLSYTKEPQLEGSIVIKTPFRGMEQVIASARHNIRNNNIESHAEINFATRKFEADINASKYPLQGRIAVKTPFSGFEDIEYLLQQEKTSEMLKLHSELIYGQDKVEVERIAGGAVLKTPMYNDIAFQFNHEGPLRQFTSHGEITYGGKRQVTGDISMQTEPSIEFTTTINTPIDIIRLVQVTAKHEGSLSNFRSEAEFTRNLEKASFVTSFDSTADIVGKAALNLPGFNEIAIASSVSGGKRDFHSHTEVVFSGSKQYELDAALNTADVNFIDGSVNIKSPFDKFDNIIINLHHRNNAERLSTTGSVEGVSSKKIEIALNLEKGQRKDLTFTLSTPFSRDIRVVMSHEGSFSNKRLSADVFYDSKEQLHVETDLDSAEKTTGSMLIRVAGNTFNALFNHRGNLQNLNNHVEFGVNGQKLESDILFGCTDNTIGSFSFKSPISYIEDVRVSFNHQSTKRNIVSHAELGYKDQNIVGDFTLKAGRKPEVSLQLQTPFSNFQNTRGAIAYTPSNPVKTVHAELFVLDELYQSDVILNTGNGLETSLTVKTPIRGYESTKIILNYQFGENRMQTHAELVYGNGQEFESDFILRLESPFEGTCILKTPFAGIENTKATFNYEFVNNRIQTHSEFIYGNQQRIESDVVLRVESPFEGSFTLRTPFVGFEEIASSFTHESSETSLKTHAEINYAAQKKIETDVNFSLNDRIDGSISLKTPFRHFEALSASFRHSGESNGLKSYGEISYGPQKKIEADLSYTKEPQLEGSIVIKTPFRGMEQVIASARHNIRNNNIESHAEINFATRKFEADINASKYPLQGRIAVKTPFSGFEDIEYLLQQEKTSEMLKLHSELIYGQDKVEGEFELTKFPLSGTLTLKTPFSGMTETILMISHDQRPSSFRSHAELVYGQQQKLEADVSLSNDRQLEGHMAVKTPFSGFEETSASFQHFFIDTNLKSSAELNYANGEKIEVDILFNNLDQIEGTVALKTPFAGYRETIALFRHNPTSGNIQSHIEISLEGQKSEADLEIENRLDTLGITTSIKSPWYDSIGLHFSKNGPLDNIIVKGEATMANRKPVMLMAKNVRIGSKVESSLTFQNPYTEEIAVRFDHNGGWSRFRSTTEASMGNKKRLHGELVFRSRTNFVNIGSSLEINFDDSQYTTGLNVKHDGDINNFKTSAVATYQGEKVEFKTQFKNAGTVEGSFTLKTPISSISNIGASFQHSGSINQFSSSGNMQYASGKQIEAKVDFYKYGWRRLSTSMELKTPFIDYRLTKMTYKHRGDSDGIQCNGELTYGSGKQMIGSLKSSLSPLEFAFAARTPFEGYEDILASAKYEEQGERYVSEANVVYKTGKKIEIKSILDMQTNLITLNARVITPFSGFESSELTLTKSGTLTNFKTTGEFHASYISPFKGEASLNFDNLSEMEGLVIFTSQFKKFENFKFNLRNRKTGDECHSHLECSWAASNAIITDTVFGVSEKWNGKTVNYGFSMSTPFESMNTVIMKGNMELTDKYADHMYIEHNGDIIVDMDMEYTKNNKHSVVIIMREPRGMMFSTNGIYSDAQKGGDATFNWDTKTSDSNVKIEGMMNAKDDFYTSKKDISLKASTSYKSLGINGVYEKSSIRTVSSFDLFIDEERKAGYELESTTNRDDQTGHSIKLRLPTRTLAFTNSYEPNSANGAFLWDAERDETKKITVTGRLVPRRDSKKIDISFSMPSIGKDVHLDSEMTLNDGRVIFDGKTEFRYSDDSRKKLVIYSKLEDISAGYSKNYSLSLGVSHPYTNVDIQMESHIGKSDEKYTAGMDVLYLTAQRQRKNFALMGEIDNYRNEINVQNVYRESPMSAQATFNPERRSMDFSMNYDIVLAEMFREENGRRVTDSLFAVRLNTTRILHTRLHWRPTMLQELKEYGLEKIHRYGAKMDGAVSEVGEAISEELNYKYNIIKQATSEDFQPFADFITETMVEFGENLQAVRREINRMYQTNEYYTQDIYVYYDSMLQDIQ
ncbi:hypothetical protein KUTeg_006534 [Tegillarca granosa]|uniref:Beta-1,3-glucan-binding protein n=1 Tax=Tegillarca granosa TaxID=220873 RepID=A0ABQ9FJP0_TEGGR|nr:hypothetical protein KUTeg_006534 [Tegillarca granosa]